MLKSLQANFILNTKITYEKSVIHKVLSIQVVDKAIIEARKFYVIRAVTILKNPSPFILQIF